MKKPVSTFVLLVLSFISISAYSNTNVSEHISHNTARTKATSGHILTGNAGVATANVTVKNAASATALKASSFIAAPSITAFSPSRAGAGNIVTISGTDLTDATAVKFGDSAAVSFTVVSPTSITAVVGAGASGNVQVITPAGTVTMAGFQFVPPPTITGFTPTSAGEFDEVTITGNNFIGVKGVTVAGVGPQLTRILGPTTIIARLHFTTSGSIEVTTIGGKATIAGFTFINRPPTITSFSPAAAVRNDQVSITGINFSGTTHVYIGGVETSFTVPLPTLIVANATSVNSGRIMVTTPGGTATSATDLIYFPEPKITSFGPTTAAQGDTVTITGTDLTGATAVNFGGDPAASFSVVSPTSIAAVVGAGASGDIQIITPGGNASLPNFTFVPPPTISSFYPDSAGTYERITIIGSNFIGVKALIIGGVPVFLPNLGISPNSISAPVGVNATSGSVEVITAGGKATLAGFTFSPIPYISSFKPTIAAQGDTVTITGQDLTGTTSVKFGGVPAASYTVTSPNSISAKLGSGASGNITITTPGRTVTSDQKFTFLRPPTITSFTPAATADNADIIIYGTNFTPGNRVFIGGIEAVGNVYVISPGQINVVQFSGANSGKIVVTTPAGTATSATDFTKIPAATIISVGPATAAEGDTVTITGTNFIDVTSVTFGGVPATSFTVTSPTSILAKVGAGATGQVTVNTAYGTWNSSTDLTFLSGVAITSFSPAVAKRGDTVTITGTNFDKYNVRDVTFGGVPAASFKVTSPTTILATVGAGASGKVMLLAGANEVYSATDLNFLRTEITSFSPTAVAQGDTVTITGTRFTGATNVMFGNAPAASFTVTSPTSISAKVGPGVGGKIAVTTPDGTAISATKLTVLPPPVIEPFYNQPGGRDSRIAILGNHLSGTTHVYIGGVEIHIIEARPTIVVAGGNIANSGLITITTPGGTAAAGYFTYIPQPSIISFSPAKAAQGDTVTITGINFADVTKVTFGGVPATSFTVISPTSISATVGSGASGKIVVTTPGITSTSATDLTFLPPPAITSFTPAAAGPGATVTITGPNFRDVTSVSIGGMPASFRVISATSISAMVAANATSGNVEVTTTGGKGTVNGFTFLPKPVITSYSPTRAATGDVITITGANFNDVTAVRFNNVVPARSFTVVSSTSIIATVGEGASGNINVVTTGGVSSKAGFFYIQAPTITSFSPATAAQGDKVTITGTNFADVTTVSIGGVAAAGYTKLSATSILVKLGPGASGKLTVTSPAGTARSATDLTFLSPPAITSFTPGKAAQGDTVTITGSNFTSATSVTFGGVPAASFMVISPTGISATVGSGANGKITVTNPDGTATSAAAFTFLPPPAITSFTPAATGQGATVTITGSNFRDVTAVNIGGVPASFRVLSTTTITAIVAANATGGNVEVTTTSGKGTVSGFTFLPKPAITSYSPTRAATGDVITITGANFTGATVVHIGNVAARSFTVVSPTTITAIVGEGASGNVTVVTTGGTANIPGFVRIEPPTITSFNPPEAPAGWDIFIFGTNLTDVTSVKFGGVAGPFTTQSDGVILAKDIWGISGKITVASPAGTATSATNFISGKSIMPVLITSFTPAQAAQGDTVAINGSNLTDATNVTFGGVPAASFIVRSPFSILATVGAGAGGDISITTPTRTVTSNDIFTFLPTPAKMSFNLAATGMEEQQTNILKDIISYPNPFTSSLALNLGDKVFKQLKVEVLNYFGKVLYSKEFAGQAGVITLDLSNLEANQIYILKLSAGNTQYITKIAKK